MFDRLFRHVPYLEKLAPERREEVLRIARFLLVGGSSVVATIVLYALISRVLWPSGPRTLEYTGVAIFVTWLNYEANRFFTFRHGPRTLGSVGRFVGVAGAATALNSFLFWFGHQVVGFWDFGLIIVNSAIIALFTFTFHRLFTFHERPWRWFGKG